MKTLFIYLTLIMISCGGNASKESSSTTVSGPCVFDYMDKYDQLLSLETIKKHYTGDLSTAKMKYNRSADVKKQKRDAYFYYWPSDRSKTMKIGGNEMIIPLQNEIGIKWLGDDLYKIMKKESAIASFKAFYKTSTAAEIQNALKKGEDEINGKVSEESKKTTMDLASGLAKDAEYQNVQGFGDAASWDVRDNALIILIGERTFKVVAAVSSDSEANKALAMKLANDILAKCK